MLRNVMLIGFTTVLFFLTESVLAEEPVATKAQPAAVVKKPEPKPAKKLAPSNLTVAQIVEKNAAARGGINAWRTVKTMSLSGKMDAGQPVKKVTPEDPAQVRQPKTRTERIERALAAEKAKSEPGVQVQVPFVMELKRPRQSRLEIQFQGETAIQVYDGVKGWKVRPFLGRREVEAYTEEELKLAGMQSELDGFLIDHAAKGYKVAVLGMEPVNGKEAYKLKVTLKGGQVRHLWIDAASFLDVKIDETRRLGGKDRAVETLLRDYKTVNGLKLPHLMETRVVGAKTAKSEKIYVEKIVVNPKLVDNRFAKPE